MKWIKRLAATLAVLVLLVVGTAIVLHRLARSKPDWYPVRAFDEAARGAAARSVEDKLVWVQSWALDANANERNRRSNIQPGTPGYIAAPDPVKEITFTEAELNAFFLQWDDQMRWKDSYSQYVDDPMIVLQDNRLILAGTVKALDMLVSLHFEPSLDADGKLRLAVVQVMGGKLPLPHVFWNSYQQRLTTAMTAKIAQSQRDARIVDDGSMNHAAMVAAMNELMLHALQDEPADPILFLHHDNLHNNTWPVKVKSIKIADKTIDLTVVSLSPDERKQLLQRIREPITTTGAPAPDSSGTAKGP